MRRAALLLFAFGQSRRAAVAVMFAVMLVPLILGVGVGVDFARLASLKASLQSAADGAALAGASVLNQSSGSTSAVTVATNYFNTGVAPLLASATVGSPTVTVASTIEVQVTASAVLQTSFMSLVTGALTVNVLAIAEGPGYALQVSMSNNGFSSSAADSDSIYYYTVPSDGTVPAVSSMTLLFTNDPAVDSNYKTDNAQAQNVLLAASDVVGFALVNKTGGLSSYSPNAYGGKHNSTHIFYSSLAAPSMNAYSASGQGTYYTGKTYNSNCYQTAITATNSSYKPLTKSNTCNAYPCVTLTSGNVLQNNLLVGSSCSTKTTANQTCQQLYENPTTFAWNDMGGLSDDYDYNDAVYTVSCTPNATGTGNSEEPAAVILVQ